MAMTFRRLPQLVFAVSLTSFICLACLYTFGFDVIVNSVILGRLAIQPDGIATKFWLRPPVTPILRVYLYNFSNVEDFASGRTHTPLFTEVGPFVFRQSWQKVNVSWDGHADTVTYSTRKIYHFDRRASVGDQREMNIVTLNIPVVSAMHQMRKANMLTVFALEAVIQSLQYRLWTRKTVEQLLWGYEEPLLKLAKMVSNGPSLDRFGFFHQANMSQDLPSYTIRSGIREPRLLSELVAFNSQSHLRFWKSDDCNMVHGSDGALFQPYVDERSLLWLFNDQLCRSLPLVYHSSLMWPPDSESQIEVYKFIPHPDVFGEIASWSRTVGSCAVRPESCYCTNVAMCNFVVRQACSGAQLRLFDISSCQFGAPVLLSFPHFFDGHSNLTRGSSDVSHDMDIDSIRMAANTDDHELYFYIDPLTGTSVSAKARLQINMALMPNDKFELMQNITDEHVIPILWFEDGVDSINEPGNDGSEMTLGQLVMSATLQPAAVKRFLGQSTMLTACLTAFSILILILQFFYARAQANRRLSCEAAASLMQPKSGVVITDGRHVCIDEATSLIDLVTPSSRSTSHSRNASSDSSGSSSANSMTEMTTISDREGM